MMMITSRLLLVPLLAALSALLAVLVLVAPAAAAPVTVTVTTTATPETLYLFVAIVPAAAGKLPYVEIAHTADRVVCEAQRDAWNAALAPLRFACLPFANVAMSTSYAE